MFGTRQSSMVTRERLPCFTHFPHVFEFAQIEYTRRDSTALGIIRTLSRIDRYLSIFLWLKHEIFTATPMSSRKWESDHSNCDCKLLISAICRRLHWYTMRCIHPSQRCIPSRQMTDNIFEIDTTALAHVACSPKESGILFTDFAAAYPSVSHSWILSVLEKTVAWFYLPLLAKYS